MSERLKSVGLDVGTTSTQMILSELRIQNRASSFAVPDMAITERTVLYRSPVHFTPLLDENRMDAAALRELVEEEYRRAGITREEVDTGAVIITGESSRKENARAVMEALAGLAGEFVVAEAGPDLESVLAAKGAGAVETSEKSGKPLLHMDIGGGTSNLCLIQEGKILRTGCLNVGGRLVKTRGGQVTYVSPVLAGLTDLKPGDLAEPGKLEDLARLLTQALEMAAGLRPAGPLLERLNTRETGTLWQPPGEPVRISFSGGVADCIERPLLQDAFGDMGPVLGKVIHRSLLCQGDYLLGKETIRATVIGAGCHSTQLSGSTVFHQNVRFPLKNLPVVNLQEIPESWEDGVVLAIPGIPSPGYREVAQMAQRILQNHSGGICLCLEQDMAKALGQALAARCSLDRTILCIDRVKVPLGSYLDIGAPVGDCLPVVVKTLVLQQEGDRNE